MQVDVELLFDVVALAIAAAVGGLLAVYMNLPATAGFLIGGMIIGPSCFDTVQEVKKVQTLASFGSIFLLFEQGLLYSQQYGKRHNNDVRGGESAPQAEAELKQDTGLDLDKSDIDIDTGMDMDKVSDKSAGSAQVLYWQDKDGSWQQTATSTTELTHSIRLARLASLGVEDGENPNTTNPLLQLAKRELCRNRSVWDAVALCCVWTRLLLDADRNAGTLQLFGAFHRKLVDSIVVQHRRERDPPRCALEGVRLGRLLASTCGHSGFDYDSASCASGNLAQNLAL